MKHPSKSSLTKEKIISLILEWRKYNILVKPNLQYVYVSYSKRRTYIHAFDVNKIRYQDQTCSCLICRAKFEQRTEEE